MQRIAVLMGGISGEHEVSLDSGINIICSLDKKKYEIIPVLINRNNSWLILPNYTKDIPQAIYKRLIINGHLGNELISGISALDYLKKNKIDKVFIALHGKFGEDGKVQALLEIFGLPYTGSGILTSALAMDKVKAMMLFNANGIKVPEYFVIDKNYHPEKSCRQIEQSFGFPCVAKPISSGSTLGVSIVESKHDLLEAIADALNESNQVIIQHYIKGIEISCGVLDMKEKSKALLPTEIITKNNFFSYQDKYISGVATEITPARLDETVIYKIQNLAVVAHQILGCRGISRTDMIISDQEIFVLETNTIPGMTKTSLIPAQAQAAGISFSKLLDILIDR